MNTKIEDLIKELSEKHEKKPFWKGFHFLLSFWLVLNICFFVFEILSSSSVQLSSSYMVIGLNISASILSWLYFTLNLNRTVSAKEETIFLILLFALVVTGFFSNMILNLLVTNRLPLTLQQNDVSCFTHIIYSVIPTAILFPFFIKHFFIEKPYWTIGFLSAHVSLLGITVMELKCHDREVWHMLVSHQTTYLPIFLIFVMIFILKKKLFS